MTAIRRREIGSVTLYVKGTAFAHHAHPSEWAKIKAAWMSGTAFVETIDTYGDELVVKLAEIGRISRDTPEGIAASIADANADSAEDAINGND